MTVSEAIMARKGARKLADVPTEVLTLLNAGKIETANLMEWLAIDQRLLLKTVSEEIGMQSFAEEVVSELNESKIDKTMKAVPFIGQKLLELRSELDIENSEKIFKLLAQHRADSVRCWAAYVIGLDRGLQTNDKLIRIQPFAADKHFCVREIAWMAVRDSIIEQVPEVLSMLEEWVYNEDENIRRFAIEATRPRGVWCKHITELKKNPEIAREILEPLHTDPSKYVQDSVGNWLNDASKTNPQWVSNLCEKWLEESDAKHTRRIVMKAMRTIDKLNVKKHRE